VDLMDLLQTGDEQTFENMENTATCVVAVQVALVDLVMSVGITPSGFFGHSLGEVSVGYVDGSLTFEETILAGYFRGKVMFEGNEVKGGMASVGLSWEELSEGGKYECPAGVYPACHNAVDNVTISGPIDLVQDYAKVLEEAGVFVRLVNSSGIPSHTPYMKSLIPFYEKYFRPIMPCPPKQRSAQWISTSFKKSEWDTNPVARTNCVEYYMHNNCNPVLFYEACQHVPEGAVIIEISPHCLFQAILKGSLPTCHYIGLQSKRSKDNSTFFLNALGNIFNCGVNPDLSKLYQDGNSEKGLEFPLTGPRMSISSLIKWEHSEDWDVPKWSQV